MTIATTTSFGEIKLAGDFSGSNDGNAPELSASGVSPGTFDLPTITINSKGLITDAAPGSMIDVYNLQPATTLAKGYVTIGSNVDVSAGVISVPTATSSTLGIAKTGVGLKMTGDVMSVDPALYPTLTGGFSWTGAVASAVVPLSVSGSVTLDFSLGNIFLLSLTGNTTLNAPTLITHSVLLTPVVGGIYFIVIEQDSTPRTLTFDSSFVFESGSSSVVSTGAGALDVIRVIPVSTTMFMCKMTKNYV